MAFDFGGKSAHDGDLYRPRMPDVDVLPTIEDIFGSARQAARGELPRLDASPIDRYLVIVTPGRMLIQQPCPRPGSMAPNQVASIEMMIPSAAKRATSVIALYQTLGRQDRHFEGDSVCGDAHGICVHR
jgi:hypothetical protein